ncbi:MAG: DDE-type integrase/transposase/recombinase [Oceanicaulis sp.]
MGGSALRFDVKDSPEIIRLAVMMDIRFALSLRNVGDLLHERRIEVSHDTVRYWWTWFGPMMARATKARRSKRPRQVTRWRRRLDKVFVKINGETRYLWCAVGHEGEVLKAFVTKTPDKASTLKFLKKAMKRYVSPGKSRNDLARRPDAAGEKPCSGHGGPRRLRPGTKSLQVRFTPHLFSFLNRGFLDARQTRRSCRGR